MNQLARPLNLFVYDQSFRIVSFIDAYSSLIWADRYWECGDFELTMPYAYGRRFLQYLKQDNYCGIDYSDRAMIIEKIEFKHEEDSAPEMTVSGRSLESILERRVIPTKTEFSNANLQNGILSLLNSNIVSPSNDSRRIPNFVLQASEDSDVTSLTFSESYNGEDLYDAVQGACEDAKIGFKLIFNDNWQMVFGLYAGKQKNVIFSPAYDNLKNSNYFTSTEEYKNLMIVTKGENASVTVSLTEADISGLQRREVLVDEDDLKQNKKATLTDEQLRLKGLKKLKTDHKIKVGIEGEIVPGVMYDYGTDYEVGDKVQLTDIYGNSQIVRISEVVISCDENGLTIVPTFEEI